MRKFYKNVLIVVISFIVINISSQVDAHNKVIVIPLLSEGLRHISNVVTVAKNEGDFRDPVIAMNSINDASADNPYLIVIAPGTYSLTETLEVKSFVSIIGSGQRTTSIESINPNVQTTLRFDGSNSRQAIVSNLTIENHSDGLNCTAIEIDDGTGIELTNLTARVFGCGRNTGVYLSFGSVRTRNLTVQVSGGSYAAGLNLNLIGSVDVTGINVDVSGASLGNTGVSSTVGTVNVLNSTVKASGPATSSVKGIYFHNIETSNPEQDRAPRIVNSRVEVSGGSSTKLPSGVALVGGTLIELRRSTIVSDAIGLFVDSTSSIIVSSSTVVGANNGIGNTGDKKCVASDNGDGLALTPDCL